MQSVREFYNQECESEWSRCERHPIEFALSQRLLDQWMSTLRSWKTWGPLRVCDVGGGPGRYSLHLARQGHAVTLLDLSDALVARARAEAEKAQVNLEGVHQGNALDLSRFPEGAFDVVLLMGPLYHLHSDSDRRRAVSEALRILKPGGLLFSSFICRFSSIRHTLKNAPELLARDTKVLAFEEEILRTGVFSASMLSSSGLTDAFAALPSEVSPFLESCGVTSLDLISCESFGHDLEDRFAKLTEPERKPWLDVLYRYCREPALMGAAGHLLHVGMKAP